MSSSRSNKGLLSGGVVAVVLAASAPAAAFERQHHLGLAPQLAILKVDGKSTASVGGGGALHYAYGLSDQFNITVEAGSAIVAADQKQDYLEAPRNRPAAVDHAAAGIGYVIDITQWVPYIGIQGGAYRLSGGTLENALILPGLSVQVGLDYQISRRFAVGVGARQHLMISKLETYPSYTTAVLRFEIMWGY